MVNYFIQELFKKKHFLIYFRQRGREREREGEKHQRVVASSWALNPGMYPDWEANQQPFDSQTGAHPTAPHQPGQNSFNIVQ